MAEEGNWLFWIILLVAMVVFLFLPQWMARRRQQKKEADLQAGDLVVTIGGFIGELTYIDFQTNVARLRLVDGVEVQILPGAISGKRPLAAAPSSDADDAEASETSDTDA